MASMTAETEKLLRQREKELADENQTSMAKLSDRDKRITINKASNLLQVNAVKWFKKDVLSSPK